MITERRRRTDRQHLALAGVQTVCHLLSLLLLSALLTAAGVLLARNEQQTAALAGLEEQLRALKSSVNTLHRRLDTIPGVNDGRPESR